jgi:hypothetical protein
MLAVPMRGIAATTASVATRAQPLHRFNCPVCCDVSWPYC